MFALCLFSLFALAISDPSKAAYQLQLFKRLPIQNMVRKNAVLETGYASELASSFPNSDNNDNMKICDCYFDRSSKCNKSLICPFDNRPCQSYRGYFDSVYGKREDSSTNNGKFHLKETDDDVYARIIQLSTERYRSKPFVTYADFQKQQQMLQSMKMIPSSNGMMAVCPNEQEGQENKRQSGIASLIKDFIGCAIVGLIVVNIRDVFFALIKVVK